MKLEAKGKGSRLKRSGNVSLFKSIIQVGTLTSQGCSPRNSVIIDNIWNIHRSSIPSKDNGTYLTFNVATEMLCDCQQSQFNFSTVSQNDD